jgi:N-acetylglucosamine-6-phosphate deacetylase
VIQGAGNREMADTESGTDYVAAPLIFDGEAEHAACALKIESGRIAGIIAQSDLPAGASAQRFDSGMIAPGFVDLQVNGGGGVMLNDDPSVEAIEHICAAHRQFGTTSLLPTLITDTREKTKAALAAGIEAQRRGVPGFRGLHLEGPHLSAARKGAHDPELIRPMEEKDLLALAEAKKSLKSLYVTVAPESVTPAQISHLCEAGIIVSLGHSDTSCETASAAFAAGASSVTHLFNAMSQIGNREPGLAGAALDAGPVFCGMIADGLHVHEAVMRTALRAKQGPGRIFLVTDAMSTVGSDIASFTLNGRTISRSGGRLTLSDGTLAGADVDMMACVRFARFKLGVSRAEALRMAALYPAQCVKRDGEIGSLKPGARADFVHLSDGFELLGVFGGAS